MKADYTTVNLELPIELKSKLIEIAKDNELSLSGLIRLILKDYVKEK